MRLSRVILVSSITFCIGVGVGFLIEPDSQKSREFEWITIPEENISQSYSSVAVFTSDIPLPDINSITAQVKFVDPPISITEVSIGYLVKIEIEALDLESVPDNYREEQSISSSGGRYTILPISEVNYAVSFTLTLKDEDGFTLETVTGPEHSIRSGQVNEIQDMTESNLAFVISSRVAEIELNMTVLECQTCRDSANDP